jgi:hypothetical protein
MFSHRVAEPKLLVSALELAPAPTTASNRDIRKSYTVHLGKYIEVAMNVLFI